MFDFYSTFDLSSTLIRCLFDSHSILTWSQFNLSNIWNTERPIIRNDHSRPNTERSAKFACLSSVLAYQIVRWVRGERLWQLRATARSQTESWHDLRLYVHQFRRHDRHHVARGKLGGQVAANRHLVTGRLCDLRVRPSAARHSAWAEVRF